MIFDYLINVIVFDKVDNIILVFDTNERFSTNGRGPGLRHITELDGYIAPLACRVLLDHAGIFTRLT